MDYERELARLESRVSSLEYELERYHEWLEASIEQRDSFLLGATWGLLQSALPWFVFGGVLYAFDKWLKLEGIFWNVVSFFVALLALGAVSVWQQKLHEDDAKKLNRLPKWRDRKEK